MDSSWGMHVDAGAPGLGSSSSSELSSDTLPTPDHLHANAVWVSAASKNKCFTPLRSRNRSEEVPLPSTHLQRTPSELAFQQETQKSNNKDLGMLNLIVGNLISTDPKLARSMIQKRDLSNKSVSEMERNDDTETEKVELFDMEW
ncbi:hypothetical protein TrLO_g13741 [Triparma laevis f. longispina]|uniref:Uncharacterized protein n=1 Tax=Triparma laevis f. longispina TaxID=1714387 RepID=A0A9W7FQB1_9STRA|nr:hypothetical protein TrLO_g13741 [Triparma laevis f. longispina]